MYVRIEAGAVVTVMDHKGLLAAWKQCGPTGLVGTYKCETPVTDSQRRHLPAELRELIAG
jgi:hypothetical protein